MLLKKTELLTNYHAIAINILAIQDVRICKCKLPPVLSDSTSLNIYVIYRENENDMRVVELI